jgi:hypothetical protein
VQAESDLPGESVYASSEKQKEIASMIDEHSLDYLKSLECCILIESITPVYCADPLFFLETGKWKLCPSKIANYHYWTYPVCGNEGDEPEIYVAKAIDYSGLNCYDIQITVKENKVSLGLIGEKIKYGDWSRTNYADHKNRIRYILAQQYDIYKFSDDDVRYVIIAGIESGKTYDTYFDYGRVFYVSCDGKEVIVDLDCYKGLFYNDDSKESSSISALSGDEAIERIAELKEKRDAELTCMRLSEKIGIDTSELNSYFVKQYNDNIVSNYVSGPDYYTGAIYHVLHISDYLERNKLIMMTTYPKAEKLIGTRYAVVEEDTELEETEYLSEIEKTNEDNNTREKQKNYLYIVGGLTVLVGAIVLVVYFTKFKLKNKL